MKYFVAIRTSSKEPFDRPSLHFTGIGYKTRDEIDKLLQATAGGLYSLFEFEDEKEYNEFLAELDQEAIDLCEPLPPDEFSSWDGDDSHNE